MLVFTFECKEVEVESYLIVESAYERMAVYFAKNEYNTATGAAVASRSVHKN